MPENEVPPGPVRPPRPGLFTLVTVLGELSLVPLALLIDRLWPGQGEGLPWEWDLRAAALGALAALPPLSLLFWLFSPAGRDLAFVKRIRRLLEELLGPTLSGLAPWQMAFLALSAGLGEEVLFRGALQARLGLWPSALIFGLLHALTPSYGILAGLLGAYLGWLQAGSRNLLVPILAHALYDLVALGVVKRDLRGPAGDGGGRQEGSP